MPSSSRATRRWLAVPGLAGLGLALAAALAGCSDPPRPFAHDEGDANALVELADPAGIAVEQLADFPAAGQKPFADALIDQLRRAEVPATLGQGSAQSLRLAGLALERPAADGREVLIHWRLTDAAGQLRGNYVVRQLADPAAWQAGDPALMTQLARASTTGIVALLPDRARPVAAADAGPAAKSTVVNNIVPPMGTRVVSTPRAPRPQVAQVGAGPAPPAAGSAGKPLAAGDQPPVALQPVEGAPGDGDESLQKAMRYFLNRASIPVVSEYDAPSAIVVGRVQVREAGAKQQDVRVEWSVYAPNGCRLGTVGQSNRIPAGQLDGKWGDAAYAVAEGAVDGLAELFQQISHIAREQRCK